MQNLQVLKSKTRLFSVEATRTRHIDPMLDQCWANVVDGEPTLGQHWIDVLCLLWAVILRPTSHMGSMFNLLQQRTHTF